MTLMTSGANQEFGLGEYYWINQRRRRTKEDFFNLVTNGRGLQHAG